MPMSKLHAWTIFKSATQNEEDSGANAIAGMVGDEVTEYQDHVNQINLELAEAVIEVTNEGVSLLNDSPVAQRLELTPAHLYTAHDYRGLVTIFEGSKYELLHLAGFFRIQNTELLFDLVKPSA